MLQQFVLQLKQSYPSIQDVRVEGSALSTPTAPKTQEAPSDEAFESSNEASDAEATGPAAIDDTGVPAGATEADDTAAPVSETTSSEATAGADAGPAPVTDGAVTLVVVMRKYQLKTVNAILTAIGAWSREHQQALRPVVLTSREVELLQRFSVTETQLTPALIVESYKDKEGYPATARRHVLAALEEIQRLLRNLEQDFPTSGQHAWNNGQQIASLLERLTRWGAALFGQTYTDPIDMWGFLLKQFSTHRVLSKPEVVHFPLRLEAFLARHQTLAPLVTQAYGSNDLEIEKLSQPLLSLARALRKEAVQRLTLPEERRQRTRRRLIASSAILGLIAVAAAVTWWMLRPPVLSAVALPKNSKPGGIVGNYYGGQNFNRFLTRRTDKSINMHWHSSPAPKVPADYYSVRWKGFLEAPVDGKYRLCIQYDDGAQFRVGNKELVNDWRVGGARTKCKVLHLEKGWHSLYLQMFEARGMSVAKLSWEHPKRKGVHPIPAKHFCCQE